MRKGQLFKCSIFVLFTILIKSQVFAQAGKVKVSGQVTADTSSADGISIVLQSTNKVIGKTNASGSFQVNVLANSTLLFSKSGFDNQTFLVNSDTTLNVALHPFTNIMPEVVVIGYGTAKKSDLTGSIVTVSSKDFQKGSITTPDQLIAGKAAGVTVTSNSGAPGAGSTIRIRGGTSLNASNSPLIVIDGVPLDNNSVYGASDPLSLINPNDIASFNILKDASATAIYGNRASNGVIIITTKSGTSGRLKVDFNAVLSQAVKRNEVKLLNGNQIRQIVNEKGTDAQKALLGTANTNWQDQIFQKALGGVYNLGISGGIKKLPYRLSVGFTGQDGILKTSNLKRTSVDLNIRPTFFNNTLHIDFNVKGIYMTNRFANESAIGAALSMDPTQPVYANNTLGGFYEWTDGNGVPIQQAVKNPLAQLLMYKSTSVVRRSIGNMKVDYHLPSLPELTMNVNGGYDISSSDGSSFIPEYAALDYQQGGSVTKYQQRKTNYVFDAYLNYKKYFDKIQSNVDFTGGYSYQEFFSGAPGFNNTNVAGTVLSTSIADSSRNVLLSFYGRLNYTFKEKYLLTATVRRDGTSRFSPNNRWGTFPSIALAWKIKEESFLKNVNAVSDLKLRLGYGVTGNQDVGSFYPYLPIYRVSSNVAQYVFGNTGYYTYRAEAYDPNIKWETTASYNAGIDFGFFKNRLTGSIDAYYKKTSNLLADIQTAAGANLSNHVLTNVGNIESKGIELALNAKIVQGNKFNWSVNTNVAYNNNKILKLSNVSDSTTQGILSGTISGGSGNSIQIQTVGYSLNTFYVYKQAYDKNGKPEEGVYADVNNNSGNLFYRYKSPNPKVTLGFTSNFDYDKWSLSFTLRGNFGNYVYNNVKASGDAYNSISNTQGYIGNANRDYLHTGFTNSQYFSDYYVENASFVRMDNVNLGYDFGDVFNHKARLSVSGTVQNVFVITKYTGLDPEVYSGIDNNAYPRPRTYSLGVNLQF
ncbi:SusC/RagA family TonB-linked outer membrane protein [Rhizosphaericola mali]|uniref:SusC/RagA family TonB-linked outer membrane protein n=1 Tax=Rhizosphaericola mali TaxID=2545455 RepID=A0A5P2GC06_9BACT|nr:SusC/RagA family TonB-linked outer membrane protein [Rhizosphaericola mali]QES89101.1 SusC/RagA family TonB-linked outer membrane protein [Rhizosphaericola mali]